MFEGREASMTDVTLQLTRNPSPRECATLLAALRYWQSVITENFREGSNLSHVPAELREHFADENVEPLNSEEIDALCEDINLQPAPGAVFPSDDEGTLPMMSTQQYAIQGGVRCPWCKSSEIEGGQFDVQEGVAFQPIHCHGCRREYTDVYRLVAFETAR
jgi:hypothetical protein